MFGGTLHVADTLLVRGLLYAGNWKNKTLENTMDFTRRDMKADSFLSRAGVDSARGGGLLFP